MLRDDGEKMNLLFYMNPKSAERGPDNVGWYLSKMLKKRLDVTCFPPLTSSKALSLFDVYRKYFSNKFDIIHFNIVPIWFNGSYMLLKLSHNFNAPTVLNIHGLMDVEHAFEPKHHSLSRILWMASVNSCKLADRVVVNSDYMKEKVADSCHMDINKIVVIPNGINFNDFSSCKSRIELDGDPAILSVGRVCMLKGYGTMVEAINQLKKELPNMKLHLVGQTNKDYIDLAKNKKVEKFIQFHGAVPHHTVPMYLKSADFSIFGSTIYEGFGIGLVEAMASGLPVIASDIDTYRQIVTNEVDGLLYKRADATALSSAILALSHDSNLRKRIFQNSQVTASQYDWPKIVDKYAQLYNVLV